MQAFSHGSTQSHSLSWILHHAYIPLTSLFSVATYLQPYLQKKWKEQRQRENYLLSLLIEIINYLQPVSDHTKDTHICARDVSSSCISVVVQTLACRTLESDFLSFPDEVMAKKRYSLNFFLLWDTGLEGACWIIPMSHYAEFLNRTSVNSSSFILLIILENCWEFRSIKMSPLFCLPSLPSLHLRIWCGLLYATVKFLLFTMCAVPCSYFSSCFLCQCLPWLFSPAADTCKSIHCVSWTICSNFGKPCMCLLL